MSLRRTGALGHRVLANPPHESLDDLRRTGALGHRVLADPPHEGLDDRLSHRAAHEGLDDRLSHRAAHEGLDAAPAKRTKHGRHAAPSTKAQHLAAGQSITLMIELQETNPGAPAMQQWLADTTGAYDASQWLPRFYAWPTTPCTQQQAASQPPAGLRVCYSLRDMLATLQRDGVADSVTTVILRFGDQKASFWDQIGGLMPRNNYTDITEQRYRTWSRLRDALQSLCNNATTVFCLNMYAGSASLRIPWWDDFSRLWSQDTSPTLIGYYSYSAPRPEIPLRFPRCTDLYTDRAAYIKHSYSSTAHLDELYEPSQLGAEPEHVFRFHSMFPNARNRSAITSSIHMTDGLLNVLKGKPGGALPNADLGALAADHFFVQGNPCMRMPLVDDLGYNAGDEQLYIGRGCDLTFGMEISGATSRMYNNRWFERVSRTGDGDYYHVPQRAPLPPAFLQVRPPPLPHALPALLSYNDPSCLEQMMGQRQQAIASMPWSNHDARDAFLRIM